MKVISEGRCSNCQVKRRRSRRRRGRKKEEKRKKGSCSHQSWVHSSAFQSIELQITVQRWLREEGHLIRSQTGSRWSLPQASSWHSLGSLPERVGGGGGRGQSRWWARKQICPINQLCPALPAGPCHTTILQGVHGNRFWTTMFGKCLRPFSSRTESGSSQSLRALRSPEVKKDADSSVNP